MSFLLLNGLTAPVAFDSFTDEPKDIGSSSRAFDGTMRRSRLATKRETKCVFTPLSKADAHAWLSLIRGVGESWAFETLYSANGLGPSGTPVYTIASAHPKFGTYNLSLDATTGAVTYAAVLGSSWTAMFWRYESAAWHHYTILSDGKKWYDGARNDALTTTWFSVSSGTAYLTNTTGAAVEYADLVLLPYLIPTDWPPVLGVATVAFSSLPRLSLSGDAISEGGTRTVVGSGSSKVVGGVVSGAYSASLQALSVSFEGA